MKAVLALILDNDHLTRGLGDAEARRLVDWLVERAEELQERGCPAEMLHSTVARLCRQARSVTRFIALWCYEGQPGAAIQLAATERFAWPFPAADADPYDVLEMVLEWEDAQVPDAEPWAA